jgi:Rrf2 family protein
VSFRLTNAGEYAVRFMVYLAGRPADEIISAREIAESQNIPERFLRSIVSQFAKLGFINAYPGKGGGVRLADKADQRTLKDVIEAVEGPIYLNVCMQGEDTCAYSDHCAVHLVWREAQDALTRILGGKTIKELAETNLHLAADLLLGNTEQMCGVPLPQSGVKVGPA